MTKTPHVHAEFIKAWADGAQIQFRNPQAGKRVHQWRDGDKKVPMDWLDIQNPTWDTKIQYRIKPEPKPDVIKYIFDAEHPMVRTVQLYTENVYGNTNYSKIKLTFDGETGKLKAVELVNES